MTVMKSIYLRCNDQRVPSQIPVLGRRHNLLVFDISKFPPKGCSFSEASRPFLQEKFVVLSTIPTKYHILCFREPIVSPPTTGSIPLSEDTVSR